MTMANNTVVEFVASHLAEEFNIIEGVISFKESSNIKWGAIGIIKNTNSGIPESLFIKYRIKIIYNNGKLTNMFVGANEECINKLSEEEKLKWLDFINEKENETK
jgi:hypothetical protein